MKVLITAGGTREFIDEIRVLTNISSGSLGTQIAKTLLMHTEDTEVFYLCSKRSTEPSADWGHRLNIIYANTIEEVMEKMEDLVPKVDVVIHAMAISDFSFKEVSTKLKSNDPQAFIDSLRERIKTNPKVISYIKKWNPDVKLISFKFEVGKTTEELIDIAYESMIRNNGDYVIANDKIQMKKANSHIAYFVEKDKCFTVCDNKMEIAIEIKKALFNDSIK